MTDFNEREIEEHLKGPDILETLRWLTTDRGWQGWVYEVAERAADEIERLRDAVDVLARAADNGWACSDLDEVIDALGFDRSQLEAELDAEIAEWDAIRSIESGHTSELGQAKETLARWDAVTEKVTHGHNTLGLHGYDIVDAELRILRHGREEDAKEIKRLRALITAWADARDAANRGEERDDDMSAEKYAQMQEIVLRREVGR